MAPYGSLSMSNDLCDNFFESLPPLNTQKDSTFLLSQPFELEPQDSLSKYCLALIDEASGEVIRAATEADLLALKILEEEQECEHETKTEPETPDAVTSDALFRELLSKGPVCRHCGVTESPQWRRGPPIKPILCNACGTRFRRTGQLNHAAQNASRKRATHGDCARELVGEKTRAIKQPRVVA